MRRFDSSLVQYVLERGPAKLGKLARTDPRSPEGVRPTREAEGPSDAGKGLVVEWDARGGGVG